MSKTLKTKSEVQLML